jgi:hypothetical protein
MLAEQGTWLDVAILLTAVVIEFMQFASHGVAGAVAVV